jgi:hypothetical protein
VLRQLSRDVAQQTVSDWLGSVRVTQKMIALSLAIRTPDWAAVGVTAGQPLGGCRKLAGVVD